MKEQRMPNIEAWPFQLSSTAVLTKVFSKQMGEEIWKFRISIYYSTSFPLSGQTGWNASEANKLEACTLKTKAEVQRPKYCTAISVDKSGIQILNPPNVVRDNLRYL
jgi:hypothetical protein